MIEPKAQNTMPKSHQGPHHQTCRSWIVTKSSAKGNKFSINQQITILGNYRNNSTVYQRATSKHRCDGENFLHIIARRLRRGFGLELIVPALERCLVAGAGLVNLKLFSTIDNEIVLCNTNFKRARDCISRMFHPTSTQRFSTTDPKKRIQILEKKPENSTQQQLVRSHIIIHESHYFTVPYSLNLSFCFSFPFSVYYHAPRGSFPQYLAFLLLKINKFKVLSHFSLRSSSLRRRNRPENIVVF